MTYSVGQQNARESKLQGFSKPKLYVAIASGLVLAVAGGAAIKLTLGTSGGDGSASSGAGVEVAGSSLRTAEGEIATPFKSEPFFTASVPLRLADPTILRSTSPQARIETVAAGRPDPFASVIMPGPRTPRPDPAATLLTPAPPAIAAQNLPALPVAATQALPPLPQGVVQAMPLPTLSAPFLPGSAPPSPTEIVVAPTAMPSFQSLIDQVVVSGVVQVGNGVSVIVTEPGSTVSRRVSQGDLLAGGRIRLKSVDMSGQEPVLVLTYEGRDYTRSVGAAMVSAL
jgi:hypothetical protein